MDYPLVSVTIDNQVVKRPCIFTHEQIEHAIDVIAYDIVTRFDKHKHLNQARPITLVAIKNGGVRFAEALYDRLCRDARVDVSYTTVSVTSYKDRKSSGHLVWREKYSIPLPGRILILCDDLADTFITLNDLEKYTMNLRKHPDAVYTAVLISKPSGRAGTELAHRRPDFTGLIAPDRFLAGYGMDGGQGYNDLRALDFVIAMD